MRTVIFERRFRGPARSANGGFACGTLASAIDGQAEVTLRAPPPLDTPLTLTVEDDGVVVLRHGETPLAEARGSDAPLPIPEPPTLAAAQEATKAYVGLKNHALPECFVCGPHRQTPDGLRVFPGRGESDGPVLAPWTPHASLCEPDGRVRADILWSTLDCPGYFGVADPGEMALLGRMTGRVFRRPEQDEPCIAMGWGIRRDGRKLYAGSAVFDASGACCGVSQQVWIKPKRTTNDGLTAL